MKTSVVLLWTILASYASAAPSLNREDIQMAKELTDLLPMIISFAKNLQPSSIEISIASIVELEETSAELKEKSYWNEAMQRLCMVAKHYDELSAAEKIEEIDKLVELFEEVKANIYDQRRNSDYAVTESQVPMAADIGWIPFSMLKLFIEDDDDDDDNDDDDEEEQQQLSVIDPQTQSPSELQASTSSMITSQESPDLEVPPSTTDKEEHILLASSIPTTPSSTTTKELEPEVSEQVEEDSSEDFFDKFLAFLGFGKSNVDEKDRYEIVNSNSI